jgi:hypothetical protein
MDMSGFRNGHCEHCQRYRKETGAKHYCCFSCQCDQALEPFCDCGHPYKEHGEYGCCQKILVGYNRDFCPCKESIVKTSTNARLVS